MTLPIFDQAAWQMSLGERAAIEGVLSQLSPALSIEIGSADGAGLQRIAAHSKEVHSFDLEPPTLEVPNNVTLHTGDSHELLPQFLNELSEAGRNVDFVIVDGDHSPEGVHQDLQDLLDSRAVAQTVILIHDVANERVRQGVEAVRFAAWPKVDHVELDWIPGQLFAEPALRNELWYGLGLVMVDSARLAYRSGPVYEERYHAAGPLLSQVRQLVLAREAVPPPIAEQRLELEHLRHRAAVLQSELGAAARRVVLLEAALGPTQARLAGSERALQSIKASASWRMTEPVRSAKRLLRRPRG